MTSAPFARTPNAEKYLLEAEGLRRRQLRTALLHGSRRTWRRRTRVWPSVATGAVALAVLLAAIGVHQAFEQQTQINQERQQPASRTPHEPFPSRVP